MHVCVYPVCVLAPDLPAVQDPSFKERFPGKSTCELISTAHAEWFTSRLPEDWDSSQPGKRNSEAYETLKEELKQQVLKYRVGCDEAFQNLRALQGLCSSLGTPGMSLGEEMRSPTPPGHLGSVGSSSGGE